jgi:bisphosphoglycerate-dependent phosphoglycerate mutase
MDAETKSTPVAYFIRHGETLGNKNGVFRGGLDFPLDANGLKDANFLKDYFSNIPLGSAYTSDALRARTTAETVLEPKGMVASETPDLRSWNTGYLSGLKKSEHQRDIDFFQNHPDKVIPNGESLDQFKQRIRPRIKNSILKGIKEGIPSITFLHSSGIHELSNMIYGDHSYIKVRPGGAVGVYKHGNKLTVKALIKDSKHKADEHYGG